MSPREPEYFYYDEAAQYLGIPRKHLENYVRMGHEINRTRVGRRLLFPREELDLWRARKEFRRVEPMSWDEYVRCFKFGVDSWYLYGSTSNYGGPVLRDAGKWVYNFTEGKLGEIALQKFLKRHFNINVVLDFTIRPEIVVGQDITEVIRQVRSSRIANPPRLRASVKATKLKNAWIAVKPNELESPSRTSEVYILSRIGLPLDHIFTAFRDHDLLDGYQDRVPEFQPIEAEVVGFAWKDDLEARGVWEKIPSTGMENRYAMRSGELHTSVNEWRDLIDKL